MAVEFGSGTAFVVARHVAETNSRYAARLLHDWDRRLPQIWQVVPKEFIKHLPVPLDEVVEEAQRA